jgi:hypothetical protein
MKGATIEDTEEKGADRSDELWLPLYKPMLKLPEYKTWDSFERPTLIQAPPLFVTEASPAVFDALISTATDVLNLKNVRHSVVDTKVYCASLLALALGRESIFYTWDEDKKSFKPTMPDIRISGFTGDILQGIEDRCIMGGNTCRRLRSYAQYAYTKQPSPCRVALASAADSVLLVVQSIMTTMGGNIRSILQLKTLIYRVSTILSHFDRLVCKIRTNHTDEVILSLVYQHAQLSDYSEAYIGDVMREVLRDVSRPWMDFLEQWTGLQPEEGIPLRRDEPGSHKGFVEVAVEIYVDDFGYEVEDIDFRLDPNKVPSFVPDDLVQAMFETGRNLRFIRTNHPEHMLCHANNTSSSAPPRVEWLFDWDTIFELEKASVEYERSMTSKIRLADSKGALEAESMQYEATNPGTFSLQLYGVEEKQIETKLLASIQMLNGPILPVEKEDRLATVIRKHLSGQDSGNAHFQTEFAPHWSLIPVLSLGPIISAQSRLVGVESLKLLFKSHALLEHLRLQKKFQLFGDGMFCSRLSHALFDPDLETAERQAGVARQGGVMGLRLSGRDNWPPASSELRLALMGILSESCMESTDFKLPQKLSRNSGNDELPGDLSFAVRDLSPEEIEACRDPDSLEALDFLRLSYKSPLQLSSIITPLILTQYDRIFKLLLRVLRMIYTVNQLFRDVSGRTSHWQDSSDISLRFCIEARRFVSGISSYFLDVGVATNWQAFEDYLRKVQVELKSQNFSGPAPSPHRLRDQHSRTLDQIMLALFLRKRQQPVLKLLEEIFSSILRFAKLARLLAQGNTATGSETAYVAELYKNFGSQVEAFVVVCKGLGEKGGYGTKRNTVYDAGMDKGTDGAREENTIDQLVLKLDMFNYYSKVGRV